MATGAEIIVDELRRAGVEVCFGLPGVHNLALWEALRESPIRLVGVRHEQAAAYAADGYARATGRLGVALTTTGPGRGQHARRGRRGVGVAVADPGHRDRHPLDAAAAGRVPRGAARDRRPGGDVRAGREVAARGAGRRCRRARPRRPRSRPRVTAPTRPAYLEVATDLLAAEVPRPLVRPATARGIERRTSRPRWRGSTRAARPLLWVGGGARDAAEAVRRLAERLGAPVLDDLRRGGRAAAAAIRAWSGCRRTSRPPGRLWDEADVVLAIGSDLDGVQTQNFMQPQPETLIAVGLERADELPRRRLRRGRRRRGRGRARRRRARARRRSDVRGGPRRGLRRARRDRAALPRRDPLRRPARRQRRRRHVHPGLLAGRASTRPPAPRRLQVPLGWGTLGYAFPAALGAALSGDRPDGLDLRRRRLPVRVRRARDDGAGADPADRRDRRRRRLRDAALRPGAVGRGDATGSTCTRRTSSALPSRSACARRRSTGSTTRSARRWRAHVATDSPSVLVARTPVPLVPPPNTSPNWYRKRTAPVREVG